MTFCSRTCPRFWKNKDKPMFLKLSVMKDHFFLLKFLTSQREISIYKVQ